jgi:hypothetical protein
MQRHVPASAGPATNDALSLAVLVLIPHAALVGTRSDPPTPPWNEISPAVIRRANTYVPTEFPSPWCVIAAIPSIRGAPGAPSAMARGFSSSAFISADVIGAPGFVCPDVIGT